MCVRGCVWRGGGYECGCVCVDVSAGQVCECGENKTWTWEWIWVCGEGLDVSGCGVELSVACRVVK